MENQEKEIFMGVVEDVDLKLTAQEEMLEKYESLQLVLIDLGQEAQSEARDEKISQTEQELNTLAEALGIQDEAAA